MTYTWLRETIKYSRVSEGWVIKGSCPAGTSMVFLNGVQVHDVSGVVDMYNDATRATPEDCAALCCETLGCASWVLKTQDVSGSGNCTGTEVPSDCCYIKPTINMTRLNETEAGSTSGYIVTEEVK